MDQLKIGKFISECRKRENLKSYSNISYINGDFVSHEFKEKFDVIYSSLTMIHFKNKIYVIDKIDSLLNKSIEPFFAYREFFPFCK